MNIQISKSDLREIDRTLEGIKGGATRALAAAINRTVSTMKTQAAARIGNDLNLKASRIKQDLSVKKATWRDTTGNVKAKSNPSAIGLASFTGTRKVPKGVSAKVYRKAKKKIYISAFTATVRGVNHVFIRQKRGSGGRVARLPIDRLVGPSIASSMGGKPVFAPLQIQAATLLPKHLATETDSLLRRANAGLI